jgi:endonuclease YncB( thermonuclease family)
MNNHLLLISLAVLLLATVPAARADKQWRKYTNCTLIESKGNDGDSFHVDCGSLKSAKARHKLIRLYFVDTPESDDTLPERLEEQRKYWNLPDIKTVIKLGKEAHKFTDEHLKKPFTVYSRLEDALGRSKIGRDAGMVWIDEEKEDLGYLLVRNGLARPGSWKTDLQDLDDYKKGKDSWARRINMAEADARREKKGCWAYSGTTAGTSPFAVRLNPMAGATPGAPATPAAPPPPVRPTPVAPPPAVQPPAAVPPPAPAARPQPPASVRPQDVVTTRPVTIYDATKLPSPVALGTLRAGMTLHVDSALSPALVRVSFTTSSGRSVSGIARLAELPPLAP